MSQAKLCPSCDGILEFIGSVGVTVHDGDDYQADHYECPEGHSILALPDPIQGEPTEPSTSDPSTRAKGPGQ
jgi:hypothetical protein